MHEKIRLSIKGNKEQALAALEARSITATLVSDEGKFGTYWDAPSVFLSKVITWFCEPAVCEQGYGFPAGTLLHHSLPGDD